MWKILCRELVPSLTKYMGWQLFSHVCMSWEIGTWMKTVYHRFCQVDPNIRSLRYPSVISCYHGDSMQILATRRSVSIFMVVVLVQFWVCSWNSRSCMVVNL